MTNFADPVKDLINWAHGRPAIKRHYGIIVYRRRRQDWWRRTYWLSCWECTCSHGPYRSSVAARRAMPLWERWATCPRKDQP